MRKLRPLFKKPTISTEDWERICEESAAAKELLEDPRFLFVRDYLNNTQSSIVDHFVRNRIKPVVERFKIGKISKSLTTTREEQEGELSGQYKFIDQFLADLRVIANQEEEYRKAAEARKVIIEGNVEKDG